MEAWEGWAFFLLTIGTVLALLLSTKFGNHREWY